MKCYVVDGTGIDRLKIIERPSPKICSDSDVLIDVKVCSLNYRDLLIAKGQYSTGQYPPFIPLSDMAGVVRETGSKVIDLKVGDRVINSPFRHWPAGILQSDWARTFIGGAGVDGVLSQQLVYPSEALIKIPPDMDFNEASTLPIAGLTAWSALITHSHTQPGDWVLLQGTGGVSIFAAQIAKWVGARTILITSSDVKAKYVKEQYGVSATVNYQQPDWPLKVKELTENKGVDVVIDVVGGETLTKSLKICNYGARISVIGILAGKETTISVFDLIQHQIQINGIFMESTQAFQNFVKAAESQKLKPAIDKIFPFEQAPQSYHYLETQKHIGKILIELP